MVDLIDLDEMTPEKVGEFAQKESSLKREKLRQEIWDASKVNPDHYDRYESDMKIEQKSADRIVVEYPEYEAWLRYPDNARLAYGEVTTGWEIFISLLIFGAVGAISRVCVLLFHNRKSIRTKIRQNVAMLKRLLVIVHFFWFLTALYLVSEIQYSTSLLNVETWLMLICLSSPIITTYGSKWLFADMPINKWLPIVLSLVTCLPLFMIYDSLDRYDGALPPLLFITFAGYSYVILGIANISQNQQKH